MRVTSNEPTVVSRSQIQPELLKRFFDGFIREHGGRDPYNFANGLESVYPDFKAWFRNRVESEFVAGKGSRELLMLMVPGQSEADKVIAGFAVLKSTSTEKKICTFRISDGWRGLGYSDILMQECFNKLGTKKPLITISDLCMPDFYKIIEKYEFKQTQALPDYYVNGRTEYVFNGKLKK